MHSVNLVVKGSAQAPNVNRSIGESCLEIGDFQAQESSMAARCRNVNRLILGL